MAFFITLYVAMIAIPFYVSLLTLMAITPYMLAWVNRHKRWHMPKTLNTTVFVSFFVGLSSVVAHIDYARSFGYAS